AAMDVDPDKEAIFNEVYDQEHIPLINKVPGVISTTRLKLDTLRITMGGETRTIDPQGAPRYAAIYELESPDVLTSPAFAKAVDQPRGPPHGRPYPRNRHHPLYGVMSDDGAPWAARGWPIDPQPSVVMIFSSMGSRFPHAAYPRRSSPAFLDDPRFPPGRFP